MKLRHPSRRALEAWLMGEPDASVESHLETCERCSNRLEETEPAEAPELRASLALAFSAPARLEERLEARLRDRLSGNPELEIIGGLFTAGFHTTKLLLDIADESAADRRNRGTDTGRGT